jgi:hypothetical protein
MATPKDEKGHWIRLRDGSREIIITKKEFKTLVMHYERLVASAEPVFLEKEPPQHNGHRIGTKTVREPLLVVSALRRSSEDAGPRPA